MRRPWEAEPSVSLHIHIFTRRLSLFLLTYPISLLAETVANPPTPVSDSRCRGNDGASSRFFPETLNHNFTTRNVMVPRAEPIFSPARAEQEESQMRMTLKVQEQDFADSPREAEEEDTNQQSLPLRTFRPETPRRITHPYIALPPQAHLQRETLQPRNRSPYSRSHLRSRSGSSPLAAPPMARAVSLPTPRLNSTFSLSPSYTPSTGSSSPQRSPRQRSPRRAGSPFRDESLPSAASSPAIYDGGFEIISEDSELDLTPRAVGTVQPYSTLNSSRTLATRRQRPTSPLHGLAITSGSPLTSSASSPNLASTRFNESFPTLHHYASNSSFSSMPSTPTSARSRSPSISSLDTIEDAPDLEYEAIEEERERKARLMTEDDNSDGETTRRRSSLEIPGARSGGFGFGRGADRMGRKRWSICGGERRADLDLETIWED